MHFSATSVNVFILDWDSRFALTTSLSAVSNACKMTVRLQHPVVLGRVSVRTLTLAIASCMSPVASEGRVGGESMNGREEKGQGPVAGMLAPLPGPCATFQIELTEAPKRRPPRRVGT